LKSNLIVGNGLVGRSIFSALSENGFMADVVAPRFRDGVIYRPLGDFPMDRPVIGSSEREGLSAYYHGVTPLKLLREVDESSCLAVLLDQIGLQFPSARKIPFDSGVFVPFRPWRPRRVARVQEIDPRELSLFCESALSDYDNIFLALSVVGNAAILSRLVSGPVEVPLSDHVVSRVGTVSVHELEEWCSGNAARLVGGGCFHVAHEIPGKAVITFRPAIAHARESVSDLVDPELALMRKLRKVSIGKIGEACYLRVGIPKPRNFAVYAQVQIPHAYSLSENGMQKAEGYDTALFKKLEDVQRSLKTKFVSFEQGQPTMFQGVHLRHSLSKKAASVSHKLRVMDTSLCPDEIYHSSIWSSALACKSAIELNK